MPELEFVQAGLPSACASLFHPFPRHFALRPSKGILPANTEFILRSCGSSRRCNPQKGRVMIRRLGFACILPFILISTLLAQYGGRGYTIVRADYGAGNSWRDVTSRVTSMIQGDSLSFRVTNETLGGDPAPEKHKTLRLQVRGAHGEMQTLSFREKDTVNLPIATAMAHGWGRQLRIMRAEYGVGERLLDETARLNSLLQGNELSLRVTNETMGGDPTEEHAKLLTVWYWYNGRMARTVVPEKSTLVLPASSFDYIGNLHVMRAQYGADYRFLDVTERLNSTIQGDCLMLRITNETMGGDPAPERPKTLTVFYAFNGQPARMIVSEKDTLSLPGNGGQAWDWQARGELEILRAVYGVAGGGMDVTARLSAQVSGDRLNLLVNDDTMGGDPAHGQVKRLKVIYRRQGLRYETNVPEKGMLSLP